MLLSLNDDDYDDDNDIDDAAAVIFTYWCYGAIMRDFMIYKSSTEIPRLTEDAIFIIPPYISQIPLQNLGWIKET